MLTLIYKDIYQQRTSLLTSAAIGAVLLLALGDRGVGFLFAYLLVVVYSFVVRATYQDDMDRGIAFLRALPIPTSVIVLAKYVSVLAVYMLSSAYLAVVYRASVILGFGLPVEFSNVILNAFPLSLIMSGLHLALFFRWNYIRAMGTIRFVYLLFLVPLFLPQSFLRSDFLRSLFTSPNLPLLFTALGFSVYIASLVISLRVFAGKEVG